MKAVVTSLVLAVLAALTSVSWYVEIGKKHALAQEKAGWMIVVKASKCGGGQ